MGLIASQCSVTMDSKEGSYYLLYDYVPIVEDYYKLIYVYHH